VYFVHVLYVKKPMTDEISVFGQVCLETM